MTYHFFNKKFKYYEFSILIYLFKAIIIDLKELLIMKDFSQSKILKLSTNHNFIQWHKFEAKDNNKNIYKFYIKIGFFFLGKAKI